MKALRLLLLFSAPLAADPFYASAAGEQAVENPQNLAKNSANLPACISPEYEDLGDAPELENLTLVGILSINGTFRSLFVDEAEKLIVLATGDWLAASGAQVESIDFKGVKFIDWQGSEDCSKPRYISRKL